MTTLSADSTMTMFRDAVRQFIIRDIVPYYERWERDGIVSRDVWQRAGQLGFLAFDVPEQYGGLGVRDFRYNAIVAEELARANTPGVGFAIHSDMAVPYIIHFGTPAQQARWLPGLVAGDLIAAIAMTEPGAGSDLRGMQTTAVLDGDRYVLNGQKTFISNGILSDVVVVAAKTVEGDERKGVSLFVVERGMDGFTRGRNLDKIGLHAQDTAELFFSDVCVPLDNRLGEPGKGLGYLASGLSRERLSLAISGLASAETVLGWTLQYVRERHAFGRPISAFQNTRFVLAELKTELEIGRVFLDDCIALLNRDELRAERAAMAKYWITDLQWKVVDQCLQLHGGYGYMEEYPIARAWRDTRAQRIYGGTNEIMKEVIGRSLGS